MTLLHPGRPVRKGLSWLASAYGLLVRVRLWCYRRGWFVASRLPSRVVSVGNLTVGGTGKTPMVILLTEWLLAEGLRVAVLSRGYKRTKTVPYLLVSNGMRILVGPSEAGDEPYLIARRCPEAVVAVGDDRAKLGHWVLDQFHVDCMILDDGFQHLSIHRDADLVLLDATDATGIDALLPAGRLREPLSGLARATAVVITRADDVEGVQAVRSRLEAMSLATPNAIEVVFQAESLVSVLTEEARPLEWGRGKRAWLVSGIGNGAAFRRSVASLGIQIVGEKIYQDHHPYCAEDIRQVVADAQRAQAALVLTTEKDAGKISPFIASGDIWWAVRLRAEVIRGEERLRRLITGEGQEARGKAT